MLPRDFHIAAVEAARRSDIETKLTEDPILESSVFVVYLHSINMFNQRHAANNICLQSADACNSVTDSPNYHGRIKYPLCSLTRKA